MINAAEIQPLTYEQLTHVAISAIIAWAVKKARYDEDDQWGIYEQAKAVIAKHKLTPDEYEAAIQRLTEAMNL